jgi:hypothetical protein
MFAFHYFCDSETHCRNLFSSVSHLLKSNGKFSLTFPNPFSIYQHLVKENQSEGRDTVDEDPICSIRFNNSEGEGGRVCQVFTATLDDCLTQFGHQYYFSLGDAVENCPEYIVPLQTVINIAMEYNLLLYLDQPETERVRGTDGGYSMRTMGQWIENQCLVKEEFLALRGPMQVSGPKSPGRNVTTEEWAAIDLYLCLTFVKVTTP